MRNRVLFVLFALLTTLSFAKSAIAEEQWYPDPTGKRRYFQTGSVVSYPGARVVKELPAGTVCAPAGELAGKEVWNSTGPDKAIRSRLTDNAKVAATPDGKHRFLCDCAGEGTNFNEIFDPPVVAAPSVPAPAVPAPTAVTNTNTNTNEVTVNFTVPQAAQPVQQQTLQPLDIDEPGPGLGTSAAVVTGGAALGAATGGTIAAVYCLDVGLSALAGTGIGAVVAVPIAIAVHHHYRHRRHRATEVQPQH